MFEFVETLNARLAPLKIGGAVISRDNEYWLTINGGEFFSCPSKCQAVFGSNLDQAMRRWVISSGGAPLTGECKELDTGVLEYHLGSLFDFIKDAR